MKLREQADCAHPPCNKTALPGIQSEEKAGAYQKLVLEL